MLIIPTLKYHDYQPINLHFQSFQCFLSSLMCSLVFLLCVIRRATSAEFHFPATTSHQNRSSVFWRPRSQTDIVQTSWSSFKCASRVCFNHTNLKPALQCVGRQPLHFTVAPHPVTRFTMQKVTSVFPSWDKTKTGSKKGFDKVYVSLGQCVRWLRWLISSNSEWWTN